MKSFKEFMKEETMPFAGTDQGFVGIEDPAVRDNLNQLLAGVTHDKFITPYVGLERVAKALANYHIFIPKHSFLEGDSGMLTFPINQFGGKMGMQNDGEVVTTPASDFTIFFEYRMGDCGMFDVFCEVVNEEELAELLADVEAELNDETEDEELDEAVLAGPETGPRKTSGSHEAAHEPDEDEDDDDEAGLVVAEENYHSSYTSAIQTAVAAAKKRSYEVDSDDYQNKVASGPRKPSEGKTVSHNIKLLKDGKPTKKGLAIQVYNRGGDKTPYELNHYISEEKLDEVSKRTLKSYIKKAADDAANAAHDMGVLSKSHDETEMEIHGREKAKYQRRMKGIGMAANKLATEEKDDAPFEPTSSTTNAKTPRNVAKRLAQKAMKQAKEKASNKK